MKKVSLLVALFIAIGAFAQKQRPQKDSFTAEQKTQLMVKKMSIELDLSAKQESKITPIIAEKVNKMEAKMIAFKEAHKKGEKKERKKLSNDEKFEKAMAHLEEQKTLQNKMKNILDKEQYAQWKKMQKKHGEKRKGIDKKHGERGKEMNKKHDTKKKGDPKGKRERRHEDHDQPEA